MGCGWTCGQLRRGFVVLEYCVRAKMSGLEGEGLCHFTRSRDQESGGEARRNNPTGKGIGSCEHGTLSQSWMGLLVCMVYVQYNDPLGQVYS
jgi:hypothetical protein